LPDFFYRQARKSVSPPLEWLIVSVNRRTATAEFFIAIRPVFVEQSPDNKNINRNLYLCIK